MDVSFYGQSMIPTLCEGDQLRIELFPEPQSLRDIKIGQIVVFKDGDEWVTHRVVQFKNKKYTKGDWSYCIDPLEPLWGKVVAVNGSEQKLKYNTMLARLSALDLSYPYRLVRWFRKIATIFINQLSKINF